MIRNERWTMGNLVLLGDAKATAHFLHRLGDEARHGGRHRAAWKRARAEGVTEALADFESSRREEVEKTQHAADVSLVWFEHLSVLGMEPTHSPSGVMTRSRAITRDNLELRAPDFVRAADRVFARHVRASGFDVDVENPAPPMFQPFRLRDMVLENRVVVSPMDMYCAAEACRASSTSSITARGRSAAPGSCSPR
jgi:anthraniloyl-CoA monooxygenase